jgi:hypothetical protein
MVRKGNSVSASENPAVVALEPRHTASLIITRADRTVWDECCQRLGLDPRDRSIRYVMIGSFGIEAYVKSHGPVAAEWAVPVDASRYGRV